MLASFGVVLFSIAHAALQASSLPLSHTHDDMAAHLSPATGPRVTLISRGFDGAFADDTAPFASGQWSKLVQAVKTKSGAVMAAGQKAINAAPAAAGTWSDLAQAVRTKGGAAMEAGQKAIGALKPAPARLEDSYSEDVKQKAAAYYYVHREALNSPLYVTDAGESTPEGRRKMKEILDGIQAGALII